VSRHTDDAPVTADAWRDWLLARVPRTAAVSLPVHEAHGHVLAEEVHAPHPLPLWTSSAMDGYAVRSSDIVAASADEPVQLRVLGEVAAGSSEDPALARGDAVRIMTGAAVPSDADAVVPVERTVPGDASGSDSILGAWAESTVLVLSAVPPGANVRLAGEDTPRGAVLAEPGHTLNAARLSALAAAGVTHVTVFARPRVAVIITGSELCEPGVAPLRGQIPESNSVLITSLLRENGITPAFVVRVHDDATGLRGELERLSASVDFIITTGGIGPGTHDVVRIALEDSAEVRGAHLAMRPGAPQRAGLLDPSTFVIALPGNPVSAAVSFEMFVRPALLAAQSSARTERLRLRATAAEGWRGAPGRLQVLPVRITETADGLECAPAVHPQGISHAVGGHGSANGYALVDASRADVRPGDVVDVLLVTP